MIWLEGYGGEGIVQGKVNKYVCIITIVFIKGPTFSQNTIRIIQCIDPNAIDTICKNTTNFSFENAKRKKKSFCFNLKTVLF